MSLDFILITHHHSDHIDGINHLKLKYSPKVIGAKRDRHRLPKLDIEVEEGKQLTIGSKTFDIYDVDGHTVGHIAYSLSEGKALFTGDSLMVMGCGRLEREAMDSERVGLSASSAVETRLGGWDEACLVAVRSSMFLTSSSFSSNFRPCRRLYVA